MKRPAHRGRGPLVALGYHSIASPPADPFDLAVSPEHFAGHVEMLARDFDVVAAEAVREPSRHPRVIVTFDDGYADNLEVAAPLLASAAMPATFFVNTPRRSEREMWWDEITHALADSVGIDFLELDVGRRIAIDVRTEAARAQAVLNLGAHLETMPPDAIEALLSAAYEQLGFVPAPCAHHRVMHDEEILELRRLGRFDIGAHTPEHAALASLDDTAATAAITRSRDHLTALLGSPPASFAYPFGSVGYTVTPAHARMVESAGFAQAFTTERQDVARWFDPYLVPRLLVGGSVDAAALRAEISAAMGL